MATEEGVVGGVLASLRIRPMKANDRPFILRLLDEAYGEFAMGYDGLMEAVKKDLFCPYLVEIRPKDKYFICATLFLTFKTGRVLIRELVVSENLRRLGVGRAVLAMVVNEHPSLDLIAYVKDDNLGAHLFFREAGFRAIMVRGDDDQGPHLYRFTYQPDGEDKPCKPKTKGSPKR